MAKKLTTRSSKGKVLSHNEMDENFEILSEVQSGNSKAIETALLNLQIEVATLKTENSILRQQVNTNNNAILKNSQEISTIGQQVSSLDDSLPLSTYNPESVSNISEQENTLSPNEVTVVINTITETNDETQEETTYKEVEYVPVVSPITPQEQISIPTVSDPEDTTEDTEPTTQFDYVTETEYLRNEVSRIRYKITGENWGMIMREAIYETPAELHKRHVDQYLSAKSSYDFWVKREYDWDNRTGEFSQIDTYPYRYNTPPATPLYAYPNNNSINYPWKYAAYPPTFVDINADNTNLTNYIGVRSASTRITNSLVDQHVNDIPVGALFAQQYSKYMYGMWDENSELSVAVDREIQAYNALATLDIWDDIKRFIHSSNILGLFDWMNPDIHNPDGDPNFDYSLVSLFNVLLNGSQETIDKLIEWANAKVAMLNLTTKKRNFATEFTSDIISFQYGLFNRPNSYGIGQIGQVLTVVDHNEYVAEPAGETVYRNYLNQFGKTYGSSDYEMGTNVTFSKMNRLFMDGTVYSSWNSTVSSRVLYDNNEVEFDDTSLPILYSGFYVGGGSLGD